MPSLERKKFIEETVSKITNENGIDYSLFDITKFLITKYNFRIGVQDLDKNTTGMLLVDDDAYIPNADTHRLIVVNRDLNVDDEYTYNLKKRFIIAHEFAHFILHKKDHTQFAHRNTDKKDSNDEKEAEFFARSLLMPKDLVIGVLSIGAVSTLDSSAKANIISRLFSVTHKKAKQRMDDLELS